MVALGALVERFKSETVGRNSPQFQIPQFAGDETQELRKYLHGFFRFDIPESYYIQLYIIIGVVSILICWGIAIILKQLYERKFWILRSQQTANVKLIIPNSTASFIVFEGIFAITWFSYTFWSRALDKGEADSVKGEWRMAFTLAAWIPLVLGAFWAAIGSAFLCPGVLSRGVNTGSAFDISRFIPSTLVLNVGSIGIPVIFAANIATIAALAEKRWAKAVDLWIDLDAELELQGSGPISPAQSAQAVRIWSEWSHGFWWISLGFLCFCVAASLLILFYSSASFVLIYKLRDQISATGIVFPGFRSLTKTSQFQAPNFKASTTEKADKEAADEEERAARSTFYPPVKNPEAKFNKAKTASERAQVLRAALINVCIMSFSINVACVGYATNTGYIAGNIYEASVAGPSHLTKVYITYNLVAGWLAAVFGSISFSNIFLNTYSTFFQNLAESKIRSRTNRSKDEEGIKSKDLMHPKVQENVELQEKGGSDVRNSLDTFGQIRTEIQLEEGQQQESTTHPDSNGNFDSMRSNTQLQPQKSFGNMSNYSEGFDQRDFIDENFFTPSRSIFEHAQMESVFEGGGIDSMIGSPEMEHPPNLSRSQRLTTGGNERETRGISATSSQDHSAADNSLSLDEPQQRWDSDKWTRAEVWQPGQRSP